MGESQTQLRQTFTILWVDDNSRVIDLNRKKLEEFFSDKLPGFKLEIVSAKDGTGIRDAFRGNRLIDIVVTDFNLSEGFSGIDVIKIIKTKSTPSDVLFYTASKFEFNRDELIRRIKYGFVNISEGTKDVHEEVIRLIKKNIRRCDDIVFLRGLVISRVIDLELKMNECFSVYFQIPTEKLDNFHNFVLENRFSSLAGKHKTMAKILETHKLKKEFSGLLREIQELETTRNLLAHCKVDESEAATLISMGQKEKFGKKRLGDILVKAGNVADQLDQFVEKAKTLA